MEGGKKTKLIFHTGKEGKVKVAEIVRKRKRRKEKML